jgi:hypothetical protein
MSSTYDGLRIDPLYSGFDADQCAASAYGTYYSQPAAGRLGRDRTAKASRTETLRWSSNLRDRFRTSTVGPYWEPYCAACGTKATVPACQACPTRIDVTEARYSAN